jgi:hypothetical protein
VAASKAILSNPATHSGVAAANAASALATLYALQWQELRQAASAQLPDVLLLASYWGAPTQGPPQLHNAAQALLASLLQPTAPWRLKGGGPAGGACPLRAWPPPAATELVSLVRAHYAQLGGPAPLTPQQLRRWRPYVVAAAGAAVPHAAAAPPALLAAVGVCLVGCLVRLAPSEDSCMAGELLELALLSGQWGAWRPHVGGAAPLLQRCVNLRQIAPGPPSAIAAGPMDWGRGPGGGGGGGLMNSPS